MNWRVTGLIEILVILASVAFGAAFIFFAYELGTAARPTEMRVWGSSESTSSSTSATSSSPTSSVSSTSSTPASGKAVFDKNCNGCHPSGGKGVGPALNASDFKQRYPADSDLAKVIRSGKGAMPPYGAAAISDGDLTALIGFIRELPSATSSGTTTQPSSSPTVVATSPTAAPPPPTSTPVPAASASGGDVTAGKAVYDKSCNACHPGGKKGVGPEISGAPLREKYPQDKDLATIIRDGRSAMPGFKSSALPDSDLASLIAYMRSIP